MSFIQEFWDGSAQTVLNDVVRLVQDRYGTWRWFFGRSREFVQEQIDRYVNQVPQGGLVDMAVADIGAFWATIFDNAGLPYHEPDVVTYSTYIDSVCEGDSGSPAAYCPRNRTIYIDLDWQEPVMQIGDFAWITILAHEWGYHVQAQLSRAGIASSFGDGSDQSIEFQADCLAGVYTRTRTLGACWMSETSPRR